MKRLITLGLALVGLTLSLTSNAEPITTTNWSKHPDIVAIRKLFNHIQADKNSGKLHRKSRTFAYCQPYADTERHVYLNTQNIAQLYIYEGGSEDSSVITETYYDTKGRLRFVFIRAGAINNTTIEHRVYFSTKGKKIWEIQKPLTGEGYAFPKEWPLETLPHSPLKAFNAEHPCLEES